MGRKVEMWPSVNSIHTAFSPFSHIFATLRRRFLLSKVEENFFNAPICASSVLGISSIVQILVQDYYEELYTIRIYNVEYELRKWKIRAEFCAAVGFILYVIDQINFILSFKSSISYSVLYAEPVMKKKKRKRPVAWLSKENEWKIITHLCVIDVKKLYQTVWNKKVTSEKLNAVDVMLFTFPPFSFSSPSVYLCSSYYIFLLSITNSNFFCH